MRTGLRFSPPQVEITDELRWLLHRAFAVDSAAPMGTENIDADLAADLALRFHLAARIASRIPTELLTVEVGADTTGWIQQQHTKAAARFLVAESICRELGQMAQGLGVPIVFLKGAALHLDRKVTPGSRTMGDVDALVPESGARALQEALIEAGCDVFETRESEHQLQSLTHRLGLAIEVHKIIPGVRLEGGSSATAESLIAGGLVRPVASLSGDSYLPSDDVMLAHLLVHGIAQHGMAPDAYPMARLLADLQDSRVRKDGWTAAFPWIERDVSRDEVDAIAELVHALETGEDPSAVLESGSGAGIMLRHLLAGVLDDGYVRSMKFRSLGSTPTDRSPLERAATTIRGALFLKDVQVDILYGPPETRLGYWGWRLWRPFDLIGRSIRYGAAWARNRFRR